MAPGHALALLLFLLSSAEAGTQEPGNRLEIPGSFNPVGSGARALGMGGAFIPVADDATAASWNPGGLVQLERPEVSLVADGIARYEQNTFAPYPEADHTGETRTARLNYLSASYPFDALGHNMIVSLNYQNLYEFGREWDFFLDTRESNLQARDRHTYAQDGALYALGLAYALQVTPTLSVGATLNLWTDFLEPSGWNQSYRVAGSGSLSGLAYRLERDKSERFEFSGSNWTLGVLWQIGPRLTLGAVVKTPFDANIAHTTREGFSLRFPDSPGSDIYQGPSTTYSEETLRMPLAYGLGLAYRHSDRLTLAADLYRTEWSRFALVGPDGIARSPLSGRPLDETGGIDDTLWVRLGGEYLIIGDEYVIPLRAGLFYDPAPAEGGADDFYGLTFGSGIGHGGLIFDVAYQYRIGREVGRDSLPQVGLSQEVREHRVYASLIVHL